MIEFAGMEMIPDLSGALYIRRYDVLVVADLHFEKGSSYARFGMHIPPFDTCSTLDMLEQAVQRFNPSGLISLGDSFHDKDAENRMGEEERRRIGQLADKTSILWITGNHDPVLSVKLPGSIADEVAFGPLTLRHEPEQGGKGIICGHLHPCASVSRRGRRIRRRCFAVGTDHLFMPAFGAYTGALDVRSKAFDAWLGADRYDVWMIGREAIHRFTSSSLA